MIIADNPPLHLTYCLNVHPGETWAENVAAIGEKTVLIRDQVAPGTRFGLGLRIAHQASVDLLDARVRQAARELLAAHNFYAFTINGFPYGRFHRDRVKEQVYAPDWRTRQRRDYTIALVNILADFLPPDCDGSISTSPASCKGWINSREDVQLMVERLADCAAHLGRVHRETGKEIHLGLEPEPGCYLETTEETVTFFTESLFPQGALYLAGREGSSVGDAEALLRRHVGVCFDTCHVAIQFENLVDSLRCYRAAGIRLSKVQLSAALHASVDKACLDALEPFCEKVYLHQVKARSRTGALRSWMDLPEALGDLRRAVDIEALRVHFHVPLFLDSFGVLGSTAGALTPAFFHELREGAVSHLEIETYTFDVLPEPLREGGIVRSIAQEYAWVLDRLGATGGETTSPLPAGCSRS